MELLIDAADYHLLFDLRGSVGIPTAGEAVEIPGGATLTFGRVLERRGVDIPLTIELALTFSGGVASGVVANWLWQKLASRAKKVKIDRFEMTEITEDRFKRIVREHIEREE